MPEGPVIAVAVLAKRHGVTARCMRRRLKKADATYGGGLLFRFSDTVKACYYVDLARLAQLLPALSPPDPVVAMLAEGLEKTSALQRAVDGIGVNLAGLRDNVAACIPRASI